MITQERLKEVLGYNPETGVFSWSGSGSGRNPSGVAGCRNGKGYIMITIDGRVLLAHRLAFLWMEGYLPETTVDHKDRVRDNNRWDNLREATYQCQARNSGKLKNNTSGIKGVFWSSRFGKWHARISVSKRLCQLGSFDDILEAAYHRYAAEQCLGFQDCDISSSAKKYIDRHK